MAQEGTVYFDRKGHFFRTAMDATISDLAAVLGQIGEGESLAPGLARKMLARRVEIEELFAEHDTMMNAERAQAEMPSRFVGNVSKLPSRPGG